MQLIFEVETEKAMIRLGELVGRQLRPGYLLFLFGELGAGKTTFTKGIALGMGVEEPITSPTFQLIKSYQGRFLLNHLDLYRLNNPEELKVLDPEELVEEGVTVVEWGKLLLERLNPEYLEVEIEPQPGGFSREVRLRSRGKLYDRVLERIDHADLRN